MQATRLPLPDEALMKRRADARPDTHMPIRRFPERRRQEQAPAFTAS